MVDLPSQVVTLVPAFCQFFPQFFDFIVKLIPDLCQTCLLCFLGFDFLTDRIKFILQMLLLLLSLFFHCRIFLVEQLVSLTADNLIAVIFIVQFLAVAMYAGPIDVFLLLFWQANGMNIQSVELRDFLRGKSLEWHLSDLKLVLFDNFITHFFIFEQ
jgi:hypothetical protein